MIHIFLGNFKQNKKHGVLFFTILRFWIEDFGWSSFRIGLSFLLAFQNMLICENRAIQNPVLVYFAFLLLSYSWTETLKGDDLALLEYGCGFVFI